MSQRDRIYNIREKRTSEKYETNEIKDTWEFAKDYGKRIWEFSKANPMLAGLCFLSGYMIGVVVF
jgi:hypothetical protein